MSTSQTPTSRQTHASKSPDPRQTHGTPRSRSRRKAIAQSRSKDRRNKINTSDTQYEILPVRPDLVAAVWPHIEEHLQRAVDVCQERVDISHVYEATTTGEYLLWLVTNSVSGNIVAAYTTRIADYPGRNALAVDFVGGSELSRWLPDALQKIEHHARRCGCDLIEGYGRAAWGRVLAPSGWEPAYTTYHKDLRHEQG